MAKRLFDVVASFLGLLFLLPFLLVVALWIKLDSRGSVLYRQVRVGRHGKDFRIFKFRTMRMHADRAGGLTVGKRDPRVTNAGYYLRKYKIDELPQLLNVLLGDMSFVGPRPLLRSQVDLYTPEQLIVLSVRPGMTAPASIHYRNENELLEGVDDPEEYYERVIVPRKVALNIDYIKNRTFFGDIRLILQTLFLIFR